MSVSLRLMRPLDARREVSLTPISDPAPGIVLDVSAAEMLRLDPADRARLDHLLGSIGSQVLAA